MKADERAFLIAAANPKTVPCEPFTRLEMDVTRQQLLRITEHRKSPESPREIGARLGMHPKRVNYLCGKWTSKGWYDWGVNFDMGWLTDKGKAEAQRLAALDAASNPRAQ